MRIKKCALVGYFHSFLVLIIELPIGSGDIYLKIWNFVCFIQNQNCAIMALNLDFFWNFEFEILILSKVSLKWITKSTKT